LTEKGIIYIKQWYMEDYMVKLFFGKKRDLKGDVDWDNWEKIKNNQLKSDTWYDNNKKRWEKDKNDQ